MLHEPSIGSVLIWQQGGCSCLVFGQWVCFIARLFCVQLCSGGRGTLHGYCACRDVASGSKRITEVNEAFHSSAETLEQQAKTYGVS